MVEVTEANAREAAAAAMRILGDVWLAETLDEMVATNTQTAITGTDRHEREGARLQVLAIMQLRANLQSVAENWRAAAELQKRMRANE